MAKVKSDIEIARKAKMKPIGKILAKIKVPDKSSAFSPMGRHIAKINFEFLDKLKKTNKSYICLMSKHFFCKAFEFIVYFILKSVNYIVALHY